ATSALFDAILDDHSRITRSCWTATAPLTSAAVRQQSPIDLRSPNRRISLRRSAALKSSLPTWSQWTNRGRVRYERRDYRNTTMVNYIDAVAAPLKNTGAIRLYGADDFAGMRKACQLTAR